MKNLIVVKFNELHSGESFHAEFELIATVL